MSLEFGIAIVLALFPFGWQMIGLPNVKFVGVLCWAACLVIIAHLLGKSTWFNRRYEKNPRLSIIVLSSTFTLLVCLLIGISVWPSPQPARGETKKEIPEYDTLDTSIVDAYGMDSPDSCFMSVNGNTLLSRQSGYRLAIACFIYDGREDLLDAPYLQTSGLYDIKCGEIDMRATFKQYLIHYRKDLNASSWAFEMAEFLSIVLK
jgi:hypothetical protein